MCRNQRHIQKLVGIYLIKSHRTASDSELGRVRMQRVRVLVLGLEKRTRTQKKVKHLSERSKVKVELSSVQVKYIVKRVFQ